MNRSSFVGFGQRAALLAGLGAALTACAPAQLSGPAVQVPTFETRSVRLSGITLPQGGQSGTAQLQLAVQVQNPNAFPLRLRSFDTDLYLTGQPVAHLTLPDVALPAHGSALQSAQASVPLNLNVASELLKVARGQGVPYRLDGTFTADLGVLGTPTFGPLTLTQGQWQQPAILPF
ncbi:LEA type 2 family protein [Deinococcus sp. Marseille-Q6407]|uniref:NDR1/HIN1-like protein n=1 Tax=Deinococcus sp. Marseille-Q6407 TaxID=2969223 RepID=UPI0021BEB901|nr:LEA type 2 family protein [Deinococcus sp. Marseille-Q6407]